MKSKIRRLLSWLRRKVIGRIQILSSLLCFKLRKLVFGFDDACNYLRGVRSTCIAPILRSEGSSVGEGSTFDVGLTIHNAKNFSQLKIGNNCHIGKHVLFDLRDCIRVGDNAVLSMGCSVITHIDVNPSKLVLVIPPAQAPVEIGEHAYLGCNVTVLSGVRIGSRAVVAAGSVVRDSVDDEVVVAGVPSSFKRSLSGVLV